MNGNTNQLKRCVLQALAKQRCCISRTKKVGVGMEVEVEGEGAEQVVMVATVAH